MKRAILGLLYASVGSYASLALEDDHDSRRLGKYFCYVDQAAGIQKHDNGRTVAGKVTLPDDDMKFSVRIGRIELDTITKDICAKTAGSFQRAFENGAVIKRSSGNLFGSETFEDVCLKPFKAEILKGGASKDAWSFRGWGAYQFEGGIANMSFSLYGTNNFLWVFPYDDGPVIRSGRCERLENPSP